MVKVVLCSLRPQLPFWAGFSPSQGGDREEEVRAGGENLLLAPLAPQAAAKNPLGAEQHLVLFGCGSPSPDRLPWFSELPEVGGRTRSGPGFALIGTRRQGLGTGYPRRRKNSSKPFWRGAGVAECLQKSWSQAWGRRVPVSGSLRCLALGGTWHGGQGLVPCLESPPAFLSCF